MKFKLDVFMTIWCALWALYSLCIIIMVPSLGVILINIGCIVIEILLAIYWAKKSKESFCNFYASIKAKIKTFIK